MPGYRQRHDSKNGTKYIFVFHTFLLNTSGAGRIVISFSHNTNNTDDLLKGRDLVVVLGKGNSS